MGKGIKNDHNLEKIKTRKETRIMQVAVTKRMKGKTSIEYYTNVLSRYTQTSFRAESRCTLDW